MYLDRNVKYSSINQSKKTCHNGTPQEVKPSTFSSKKNQSNNKKNRVIMVHLRDLNHQPSVSQNSLTIPTYVQIELETYMYSQQGANRL